MTPDTEMTLSHGDFRLVASPYGASLRGLYRRANGGRWEEVVTGYSGAQNKAGGQGDVLIPFPGRVGGGRYVFEGTTYQMALNDKEGPNAIHGFLRSVLWEVEEEAVRDIRFGVTLRAEEHAAQGYPFSLRAQVAYQLEDDGMTCAFAIRNLGTGSAPVAAGFHPYFAVGSERVDEDVLHVPFASFLEFDARLIPTGGIRPVDGTPLDFRAPRVIGATPLNTCYVDPLRDPDGLLRVRLSHPGGTRSLTVWMDEACSYVVVYSGDAMPAEHRRRSLAIEPMTCGSDAFNHPAWGLRVLAPGEEMRGRWGVVV